MGAEAPALVRDIPSGEQTSKPTSEEVHAFLKQVAADPKLKIAEVVNHLENDDPVRVYEKNAKEGRSSMEDWLAKHGLAPAIPNCPKNPPETEAVTV